MYLGIDFNDGTLKWKDSDDIVRALEKYKGKGRVGYVGAVLNAYRGKLGEYTIRDIIDELGGAASFLSSMIRDLKLSNYLTRQNIIYFETNDFDNGMNGSKGKALLKYAGIFIDENDLMLDAFLEDTFLSREKEVKELVSSVTGGCYAMGNRFTVKPDAAALVDEFYRFLKGEFHPVTISKENAPSLPDDQAWHVIYVMQEYFGMLNEVFERCDECGRIYDSEREGGSIDGDSVNKDGESYPEEDYGHYCGKCL